jgi:hypothetical protein
MDDGWKSGIPETGVPLDFTEVEARPGKKPDFFMPAALSGVEVYQTKFPP